MTAHSEYGVLKEVFLKSAEAALINQSSIDTQWEDLNFLSRPDYKKALKEYEALESLLKKSGTAISYFPQEETVTMDSMYCRDASIITDFGVILCNMGKDQRQPEPAACEREYLKRDMKILGRVTAPGKIEGGDVAWLDKKTLAVGHGYRTNDEGFLQVKAMLEPHGVEVIQVDLPHYKGQSDVFHLMSILSPVDANKAVVYSPLMPVRFRNVLLNRGFLLIEVPDEEFEMGCNVLAIAPSECIVIKGFPITKARLEAAGCIVHEYEGSEISVKGGGGPTCLTRPVLRNL